MLAKKITVKNTFYFTWMYFTDFQHIHENKASKLYSVSNRENEFSQKDLFTFNRENIPSSNNEENSRNHGESMSFKFYKQPKVNSIKFNPRN